MKIFLKIILFLLLAVVIAVFSLGVFIILYCTHPEITFIQDFVNWVINSVSFFNVPDIDSGKLFIGLSAVAFIIIVGLLILLSEHKLIVLRIALVFVFLLTGSLSAAVFLSIYRADITFIADLINPIFPDNKMMWGIVFGIPAIMSIVGFILATVIPHKINKRYEEYNDSYNMSIGGFSFDEDGDTITVIDEKGYDPSYNKICLMFQKMFNNGYCRIMHVELFKKYVFKRCEKYEYVSNSAIIDYEINKKKYGEPYSKKENVYKTRLVTKEFVVTKSGEITLHNGHKIFRDKGDTFKDQVEEKYVAGTIDVWYQNYEATIEFYFNNGGKVVTAEDGTKMIHKNIFIERV